jgi:hypothetical protein
MKNDKKTECNHNHICLLNEDDTHKCDYFKKCEICDYDCGCCEFLNAIKCENEMAWPENQEDGNQEEN